jgi:DNA (cytosine-5)-methyltransferase 1
MRFFDFCSGIGAGRLGLELNGLNCVGHCEINPDSDLTYNLFFNDSRNFGDLMTVDIDLLPDFEVMIAGFPCQTFSIVGKREGFNDDRGLIIFRLAEILKKKNVKAFILENVKGLVSHDKGNTLKSILELLDEAGYYVDYKVLNSLDFGVPQMRERIYFVGTRKDLKIKDFEWDSIKTNHSYDIKDFLIDEDSKVLDIKDETLNRYLNNKYNKGKFNLSEILKEDYLVLDTRQSDLRLYKDKCPTLRTGRHGILYVKDNTLKKLSGYEALLLQGFSKELASLAKNSDIKESKLLSQAGNAMTANVIDSICFEMLNCINKDN